MTWISLPGAAALLLLASCSASPLLGVYVLSTPSTAPAAISNGINEPRLQLQKVSVPDYLDSTDILLRVGKNELKASKTGQWGERLSKGMTDALAAALGRRLPGFLVTSAATHGEPGRRLLVDVEALDVQPDGRCAMSANWTVLSEDGRTVRASGRGSFEVASAATTGDATVVAAMTNIVGQLAASVANSVSEADMTVRPSSP